jgi:O-antigen ligase/polysaccharide polymerase Wzy-like membrane protein
MRRAPVLAAESLTLLALCLAPWPFGSATDSARYLLAGTLLLANAAWMAMGVMGASASSKTLLPFFGLPLLCLTQMTIGASAAAVWTAEALLVIAALLATLTLVQALGAGVRGVPNLAIGVLFIGLAQAAFGAYSWSIAPTRIYGVARQDVTMPFGSFVNHNHFAGFVEMPALLALGMAIGHARRAHRITPASIACAGAALALAAAHLASRSRGGLIALAAGLFVLGLLAATALFRRDSRSGGRRLVLTAVCIVVVLGFAWLSVAASARRHLLTLLSGPSDASGSYRVATAAATLRLAAAHPLLGSGLGAYEDAIPRHKTSHGDVRTTHAESDVLEFVAEGGLLGLAALGWLATFLVRRFGERLAGGRDAFWKGTAIGAISGVAALGVHSLFDFNLRIPSNALVFVVLLGLASPNSTRAEPAVASGRAQWLAATLLGLLALLSLWRAHGADSLDRATSRADVNARIEALDLVTRLHPYLAEAWHARAVAWRELASAPSALRAHRLARAVADFSQALRLRPHWADALAGRGWSRGMLGDLEGGARDLGRAVELDPTHAGIRLLQLQFDRARNAAPRER